MRVSVIGVGSPLGDDAAGLLVAARLSRAALPAGVSVCACARPFPDLLEALEATPAAIVVDAMRSGNRAGSVRWLAEPELAQLRGVSSHDFPVASVLALAAALGKAPEWTLVLGIEADPTAIRRPSPMLARGVERACELVLERLAHWSDARAGSRDHA